MDEAASIGASRFRAVLTFRRPLSAIDTPMVWSQVERDDSNLKSPILSKALMNVSG